MALYHRHRPQTFADIVDQSVIISTLENQLKSAKISHAYLFSGPRGVGKTTTARILAKAVNCTERTTGSSEPCNSCTSCQEITANNAIDVIEIDAASHTGVDNVRQNIIENAQFKPTKSAFKVFIIDEVHMLSTAAFNALLKTLEEPPSYILFILATTDPHKIPATIISRCQRFTFHKVASDEMKKHLKHIAKQEGIKIDDDILSRIVHKSEGCARDAISLLDQLMASGDDHITAANSALILPSSSQESYTRFATLLFQKNAHDALAFIHTIAYEGISLDYFMRDMISYLRMLMIASVDEQLAVKEYDISDKEKKAMHECNALSTSNDILRLIDIALRRYTEMKTAALPQLPLEMLIIEWIGSTSQTATTTTTKQDTQIPLQTKTVPEDKAQQIEKNTENITVDIQQETTEIATNKAVEQNNEETKTIINNSTITQNDVEQQWISCISHIESTLPSLSFILKSAHIHSLKNNTVCISVLYDLHKDKLLETKTKKQVEDILSKTCNASIIIDVIVEKKEAQQQENLADLAAAFGGEVMPA